MTKDEQIASTYLHLDNDFKLLISELNCSPYVKDEDYLRCLVHIFSRIKDPRIKSRSVYKMSDLLALYVFVLVKKKKPYFHYVADYVKEKQEYFRSLGLIDGDNIPSHDTFRRIFIILDSTELIKILVNKLKQFFDKIEKKGLLKHKKELNSEDGQFFNATGRGKNCKNPKPNVNVVSCFSVSKHMITSAYLVDDKTNEIPVVQKSLRKINGHNKVFTFDALHCQPETCDATIKSGGDYILSVKTNQKGLFEHIQELINKNPPPVFNYNSCEYQILELKETVLAPEWPGLKKVIKMISHKRDQVDKFRVDEKEPTTHFFITSLKEDNEIIAGIDERWGIENGPHKFKDDYLKQDSIRITDKNAIKNLNIINNFIYSCYQIASMMLNKTTRELDMIFDDNPLELFGFVCKYLKGKNLDGFLNQCLTKKGKLKPEDLIEKE